MNFHIHIGAPLYRKFYGYVAHQRSEITIQKITSNKHVYMHACIVYTNMHSCIRRNIPGAYNNDETKIYSDRYLHKDLQCYSQILKMCCIKFPHAHAHTHARTRTYAYTHTANRRTYTHIQGANFQPLTSTCTPGASSANFWLFQSRGFFRHCHMWPLTRFTAS